MSDTSETGRPRERPGLAWREVPGFWFGKRRGDSWSEVMARWLGSLAALLGTLVFAWAAWAALGLPGASAGFRPAELLTPLALLFAAMAIAGWSVLVRDERVRRRRARAAGPTAG